MNCTFTQSIQAHDQTILTIASTKNKKFIISGSNDKSVKIFHSDSLSMYATLLHHQQPVWSVTVTPDDKSILSGSQDDTIILWNIESKSKVYQFTQHNDFIFGVRCVNDQIISVSRDSRISISKLSSKKFNRFLTLKPFTVGSEVIKDSLVVFGCLNEVVICDVNQIDNEKTLVGHSGKVHAIAFSSKSNFLISCCWSLTNNLIIWDLKTSSISAKLNGHTNSVFCVDISSDDSCAISGDANSKVLYWNLKNLSLDTEFTGHSGHVHSVKFTKNKTFAVSGGSDRKVIIWDLGKKFQRACLNGHNYEIWKVLITSDDKYAVSGDSAEGIRVWDIYEKKLVHWFRTLGESREWLAANNDIKESILKYLN